MRITLMDRQEKTTKRKGRHKRTFDTLLAPSWGKQGRRPAKTRVQSRRTKAQAASRQVAARQAATRQSSAPESPASKRPSASLVMIRAIARWLVPFRWPAILLLAGLVVALAYASSDERFFVYEAQVIGASHIDAAAIYTAAAVHELNIFWIHPARVAERIMELDGIKAVQVRCRLPARVTIEVEEREPLVLWRATGQERDWWLDDEGLVLPYHGDPRSTGVHFVVDLSPRHFQPGTYMEPTSVVDSVLKLAKALPEADLFYYQEGRGLSYTARSINTQWTVYVGSSDHLAQKIQVLAAITDFLIAERVQPLHVDVRWPDHPVYALPEGQPAPGQQ